MEAPDVTPQRREPSKRSNYRSGLYDASTGEPWQGPRIVAKEGLKSKSLTRHPPKKAGPVEVAKAAAKVSPQGPKPRAKS